MKSAVALRLAYPVSLRSVTLTRRQRVGRVESRQRTLVVIPFVGTLRLMTGRRRTMRLVAGRRGRGIGPAGVRGKTRRRRRRRDGQSTVTGSGTAVGGRGVRGNAGRIGRRVEIGRGRGQAEG